MHEEPTKGDHPNDRSSKANTRERVAVVVMLELSGAIDTREDCRKHERGGNASVGGD